VPAHKTATNRREHWLIIGHGSVGSFIAARLADHGASVSIFDPAPRVPITRGTPIDDPAAPGRPVDYISSCVPPAVAESVPERLGPGLRPHATLFDWNTVSPLAKQRICDAAPGAMIDVALLDSVDALVERPNLAISGTDVEQAARILGAHGFKTSIAGDIVGQAASLKYLRSIFMKGLEALVLEYASLASGFEGEPIVRASLADNLGEEFVDFMDHLLATDRIHAERRSRELADAVAVFTDGVSPALSVAAVSVLQQAAVAWAEAGAPAADADMRALASHLRRTLWREPAST
jgi:hypothetical protein